MEQGVSARIGLHSLVKGLEYKRIVIVIPQHIGHNAPVIEIQNSAEIDLVYFATLIPLELGHVGQPFLIRLFRIELSIQKVFSQILMVLGLPGTAVLTVLHGRPNISGPADTKHSLVIDMDTVVMAQIIIEPTISLVWAFRMNFLDLICQPLILCGSAAPLSSGSLMVSGTGHME